MLSDFFVQIQAGNECFLLYIMLRCSFVDLFRSEFSSNLMKVSRVEVISGGRLPARAERIQKFVDTEEKEGRQNRNFRNSRFLAKIFWEGKSTQFVALKRVVRCWGSGEVIGGSIQQQQQQQQQFFFTVTVNRSYSARWHEGHFGPAASRSKTRAFRIASGYSLIASCRACRDVKTCKIWARPVAISKSYDRNKFAYVFLKEK